MKTFKEYLTESKKVYNFKVKVAGDLPENFEKRLKTHLDVCGVMKLEKIQTTPVQSLPLDFPTLKNCEVHIYEVICEYPITAPQITSSIKEIGLDESAFRVRGSGEPSEVEQLTMDNEPSGESLLDENDLDKGLGKIKHKDYFGDDFNKGFLKDLAKAAKERTKEGVNVEYKLPKGKTDKTGAKSAIGS